MHTDQFVQNTLEGILRGVNEAQKTCAKSNGFICNRKETTVEFNLRYGNDGHIVSSNNNNANLTSVKFNIDIALPDPLEKEKPEES